MLERFLEIQAAKRGDRTSASTSRFPSIPYIMVCVLIGNSLETPS